MGWFMYIISYSKQQEQAPEQAPELWGRGAVCPPPGWSSRLVDEVSKRALRLQGFDGTGVVIPQPQAVGWGDPKQRES
jgi:hypothetical protein